MTNRKYERPEVKQITKLWVKEYCKHVTERDMGLLQLLPERKLLRRNQIEILYPKFASTDRLNKRLRKLYELHVIDRIFPRVGPGEGSSQQYICLDRAGIILLGIERYNKPITTDVLGNKALPLGWEHRVLINDYECHLVQLMHELGGSILAYESERPHSFGDTILIPDIFCLFKISKRGFMFFIEVDLGTEDIPRLKHKLDLYTQYYLSKSWLQHDWAHIFHIPTFPRVLLFTEEGYQRRLNVLQEHTRDALVEFYFGFHNEFPQAIRRFVE